MVVPRSRNPKKEQQAEPAEASRNGWLDLEGLEKDLGYHVFLVGTSSKTCISGIKQLVDDGYINAEFKFISAGADGAVYVAQSGIRSKDAGEFLAVKIYGSTRDHGYASDYNPDNEWSVLMRAWLSGVSVPEPVVKTHGILVTQFIGYSDEPAYPLEKAGIEDQQKVFAEVINQVARLGGAGIAHGDLHDQNILVKDGVPYIIDFSRASISDKPLDMPPEVDATSLVNGPGGNLVFLHYLNRVGIDINSLYKSVYTWMLRDVSCPLPRKEQKESGSEHQE